MLTSHVTGNVTCWQVTLPVTWLCVTKVTKVTKYDKYDNCDQSDQSDQIDQSDQSDQGIHISSFWDNFWRPSAKYICVFWQVFFTWRKSQPLLIIINPQLDFVTWKETCQKRPTKSCGLGNTLHSPQLPAPYFFLKHFYILWYVYFYKNFFICLVKI